MAAGDEAASSAAPRDPESRLAAALHPLDPRPEALVEPGTDPLDWIGLLGEHKVAGLTARALEAADRLGELEAPARRRLQSAVMDERRVHAELDAALLAACDALVTADIDVILLKGAALGRSRYPQPWMRPMSDVDLLVRDGAVDVAIAALRRAGFDVPDDETIAFWREAYYNLPLTAPGQAAASVEIHWSIAQERQRPDVAGLFERAVPVEGFGARVRRLSDVDLLLHQALHHAYHLFQPRLVWIHDLAILHAATPALDEAVTRARAWGMRVPLALSCLLIDKVYPGVVDGPWLDWARGVGRARALVALAGSDAPLELLRGWQHRRRQLVYALLMLDGAGQIVRGVAGWVWRSVRFGDRGGHDRLAPRPD